MVERYPLVGGIAAWRIPCLFGPCVFAAEWVGDWALAGFVVVIAATIWWAERSVVIEVLPAGLSRGLVLGGKLLGPAPVIPWRAVAEVATTWRHPRDFTALDTVVTGRDGEVLRFSTRMGLGAYRGLLARIARHALDARRTGLTDQFLAEQPISGRHLARRFATALSALGLLVVLALAAWG